MSAAPPNVPAVAITRRPLAKASGTSSTITNAVEQRPQLIGAVAEQVDRHGAEARRERCRGAGQREHRDVHAA
jgi:hypothetical protein